MALTAAVSLQLELKCLIILARRTGAICFDLMPGGCDTCSAVHMAGETKAAREVVGSRY
jgi:hypothetical protein